MEEPHKIIEPLLKSLTEYGHTYVDLLRLKSVRQVTDLSASILTKMVLILFFTVFIISLNIALALWLGDYLGKPYLGFLSVAGIYALICLCLLMLQPTLKRRLQNTLIQKMQAKN
jgi:hypothetical protein